MVVGGWVVLGASGAKDDLTDSSKWSYDSANNIITIIGVSSVYVHAPTITPHARSTLVDAAVAHHSSEVRAS